MINPPDQRGEIAIVRPSATRLRIAVVLACGFWGATLSAAFWTLPHDLPSDIAQLQAGAHALRNGQNPYDVIGPGRVFDYPFLLFYPMPAVYAAIPLTAIPMRIADPLVTGLGAAGLAWVLTRERVNDPRLLVFASFAFLACAQFTQWPPALVAATFLPWLSPLLAVKPTIAAALWLAFPSWKTLLGASAIVLLSLILHPWWLPPWIASTQTATHVRPLITLHGGPLLLAALWKWREPHARLLVALASVPQSPFLYEAIPLFLIPRSWESAALLVAGTVLVRILFVAGAPYPDYVTQSAAMGQWMIWCLYLPCLYLVLRRETT